MNNSFGKLFGITTFGESHGKRIGCIVDGCPANFRLTESDLQRELERRRPGKSELVSPRSEKDRVEILAGMFNGKTTGSPIALLIGNSDVRSKDYSDLTTTFRPGHADFSYFLKYTNRDHRGGGRSSARLTAAAVAGGAVAKKWLRYHFGTTIQSFVREVGTSPSPFIHWYYTEETTPALPTSNLTGPLRLLKEAVKSGDSVGSEAYLCASNVPVGIGEPLFNKLSANLASGILSINAIKSIRIGHQIGLRRSWGSGSQQNDPYSGIGILSNNWGGIAGGISTGQDLVLSVSAKPTSSINQYKRSVGCSGGALLLKTRGRHDPCVGLRVPAILEAMVAIVTMDLVLQHTSRIPMIGDSPNRCHPQSFLY